MEKIRTFIAVNLSSDVKEYLASLANNINTFGSRIKWVDRENLHVTIKFLGDMSPNEIELVKSGLKEIGNQHNPFSIQLSSYIGAFPTYGTPRIIWTGIKEGANELEYLFNSTETILLNKGFTREERGFSGHITIGRVKFIKDKEKFSQILKEVKIPNLSQKVSSIDLMESVLTPNGPIYKTMVKFTLWKK